MADWPSVPLEKLIESERGISYGIVQPGPPVPNGVPIVRVSDVKDRRIATTDCLKVSPEIESGYARTRLRGGELLITNVMVQVFLCFRKPDLVSTFTDII